MDLDQQTILVTGSDGGIGRALVQELAKRDVHVLCAMRDVTRFELVSGGAAREVRPVPMDLSSRETVEHSVAQLADTRVDVLINNAGQFAGGLFEEGDLGEFYEYSASKAAVVGFSEALRRELEDSDVGVLHLVTPGVETDMLAEVRADYEPHLADPSKLEGIEPGEWAAKIVQAIEDDDEILNPGGAERLAKLAARGPAGMLDRTLGRVFER
jgi:short-subunit dehydrogenase